jgi:hypothetical protein
MICQLRITNLLVAMVTFTAGVWLAGLFSAELSPPSVQQNTLSLRTASRKCSVPGVRLSEREGAVRDAIRDTELKLAELRKQSSLHSSRVEEPERKLRRQLEERLSLLLDERNFLTRERFREIEEEAASGGTRLVYREVCYEN